MLNYSIAAAKLRHQLLSSEKKIIFPLPTLESIIFVVEIMSFLKSLGDTRRAGVSITTNNDTKTTVSPRGEINDLGYKKMSGFIRCGILPFPKERNDPAQLP